MKLTNPQRALLEMVNETGFTTCSESYPPARKLVELGLVVWRKGKYSGWLEPTQAGKDELAR